MLALGRSRMTVSLVPGRHGVGSVCVPTGVGCPVTYGGVVGVWPLFQFDEVVQSPLLLFIHNAGTR